MTYRPHYDQHQPGIVTGYEAMHHPHPLCPKLDALGLPWFATDDGACLLVNGDCLKVLPLLEAGSVDAVVTDPPYGIVNEFGENTGNGKRTMQFEWDSPTITLQVLEAIRLLLSRCHARSGCFIFCGGDQFGGVLEVVRQSGFTAKPAAWVKDCPPPAGKGNWWPSGFEFAVYGYRTGAYFGDTDPKRSNVFRCDSYRHGQPGKVDHPTQKPLKLVQRIVTAIGRPGANIVDCFSGSGTTAIACLRTGRRFIGVELEPKYYAIACERITKEIKRTELLEKPPQIVQRNFLEADECKS